MTSTLSDDEDEIYYEVETILDCDFSASDPWYLIKWKNYDESKNSWEPEANLNCPELLREFHIKHKGRNKPLTTKRKAKAKIKAKDRSKSPTTTKNSDSSSSVSPGPSKPASEKATSSKLASSKSTPIKSTPYSPTQPLRSQFGTIKRPQKSPTTSGFKKDSLNLLLDSIDRQKSSSTPSQDNPSKNNLHDPSQTSKRGGLHTSVNRREVIPQPNPNTESSHAPSAPSTSAPRPGSKFSGWLTNKRPSLPVHDFQIEKRVRTVSPRPKSTPPSLEWVGSLYKGARHIAEVKATSALDPCPEEALIKNFLSLSEHVHGKSMLQIQSLLPIQRLEKTCRQKAPNVLVLEPRADLVSFSKLRSFLLVNNSAGVITTGEEATDAFVVIPNSELIARLLNLNDQSRTHLFIIYLSNLTKRPKGLQNSSELVFLKDLVKRPARYFLLQLLEIMLKFPPELVKFSRETVCLQRYGAFPVAHIKVYGKSRLSHWVRTAVKPLTTSEKDIQTFIMLFDRSDKSPLLRSLRHQKLASDVRMWEFGNDGLPNGSAIAPMEEIFPKDTGGFLTTDLANIMAEPLILDRIVDAIRKMSKERGLTCQWQFILPHSIFRELKAAMAAGSTQQVRSAATAVGMALVENNVNIVKDWQPSKNVTKGNNAIEMLNTVAMSNYKNRQFFVYVDDRGTMDDTAVNYPAIDVVKSTAILQTFT